MNLKINVYNDCTTEGPSKTYEVRRVLFKTAKRLGALRDESAKEPDEKQEEITLKMLQAIIPEFTAEDLDGVDPVELGDFLRNIGAEVNTVISDAAKN